jgi:hypothetical protein
LVTFVCLITKDEEFFNLFIAEIRQNYIISLIYFSWLISDNPYFYIYLFIYLSYHMLNIQLIIFYLTKIILLKQMRNVDDAVMDEFSKSIADRVD